MHAAVPHLGIDPAWEAGDHAAADDNVIEGSALDRPAIFAGTGPKQHPRFIIELSGPDVPERPWQILRRHGR